RKERLAGHPAVLHGQVPGARLLALADDDAQAVVLHVERLAAALDAVAEYGHRFVAEDGADLVRRIVAAFDDRFLAVADLDLSHGRFRVSLAALSQWRAGSVSDRSVLAPVADAPGSPWGVPLAGSG